MTELDTTTSTFIDIDAQLEECTRRIMVAGKVMFLAIGEALELVSEHKLYKNKWKSFEDYCLYELDGIAKSTAYALIEQYKMYRKMSAIVDTSELDSINQGQLRELKGLEPADAVAVWRKVRGENDGRVTGALIKATRNPPESKEIENSGQAAGTVSVTRKAPKARPELKKLEEEIAKVTADDAEEYDAILRKMLAQIRGKAVRAWAMRIGKEVPARGKLSDDLIREYEEAHK